MQITISIPDKPFVAEPRESISRKIRLYAALGLYRARNYPLARRANWPELTGTHSSISASARALNCRPRRLPD